MDIKELAAATGVSEKEVEIFARGIIHELTKDGADSLFVEAGESDQCAMVEAYAIHTAKMMEKFHTAYITNTAVKSVFDDMVYAELKYDAITEHNKALAAQGVKR